MHEFSLINDLMRKISDIAAAQKAKRVVRVKVKLGALCHISAEHFREHFVEAAAGTIAEDSALDVEFNPDESHPNAQDILLDSVEVED